MYLDHYGLLEAPFSIAPDPRYLYMSERHREALAHLLYGLESDGAFILLTGDVGTGKTTVSRCLLEQVPDDTNLALVLNPKLSSIELLQVICDELRINYEKEDLSVKTLVDFINRYLLGAHAQGKKTVVLIEEAQNLDLDVLEQLRLLTNLETNERKLLQVILLGQPEFLDVLDRPELSQLAQRITARFHLTPLKLSEVEEYVSHRLAIAGCRRPLFAHGVIKRLFAYSGGVPRLINVICDRALLGCYVQNRHQIDKPTLIDAAKEVLGDNKASEITTKNTAPFYKVFAVFIFIAITVTGLNYFLDIQLKTSINIESPINTQVQEKEQTDPVKAEPISELKNNKVKQEKTESIEQEELIPEKKPVLQSAILWPDRANNDVNNLRPYQALYDLWGIVYKPELDTTPCYFAITKGLSCLHKISDIDAFRQYKRPAVLTLYDDLNHPQYITLIGLTEYTAKIILAGQVQIIPLEQLDFYWKGEFSLLWKKPSDYQDIVNPGSAGKIVLWLSQKMIEINQLSGVKPRSYYDKNLVDMVKAFQLREGLKNDGMVGVKTLISINQVTGINAPLLEIN